MAVWFVCSLPTVMILSFTPTHLLMIQNFLSSNNVFHLEVSVYCQRVLGFFYFLLTPWILFSVMLYFFLLNTSLLFPAFFCISDFLVLWTLCTGDLRHSPLSSALLSSPPPYILSSFVLMLCPLSRLTWILASLFTIFHFPQESLPFFIPSFHFKNEMKSFISFFPFFQVFCLTLSISLLMSFISYYFL